MPDPLSPLLPLLGRFAPDLIGLAHGGRASAATGAIVAGTVAAVLRDLFGTADPASVQSVVEADPSKAATLQARLGAEAEALKARFADAVETADARVAPTGLPSGRDPVAWGSPVVSAIVLLAFAAVAVLVFLRYGVDSAVGQLIAGALIAKFGTVVDYWLGSSKGSSDRADQITAMLHQSLGFSLGGGPASGPDAAATRRDRP